MSKYFLLILKQFGMLLDRMVLVSIATYYRVKCGSCTGNDSI